LKCKAGIIALYTLQIVSKQLHCDKQEKTLIDANFIKYEANSNFALKQL